MRLYLGSSAWSSSPSPAVRRREPATWPAIRSRRPTRPSARYRPRRDRPHPGPGHRDGHRQSRVCLGAGRRVVPAAVRRPRLEGWDWAEQSGVFDQQGEVRWGAFAVTGTGTAHVHRREPIPAALYDAMAPEAPTSRRPPRRRPHRAGASPRARRDARRDLPGATGEARRHVLVNVDLRRRLAAGLGRRQYGKDVVVVGRRWSTPHGPVRPQDQACRPARGSG